MTKTLYILPFAGAIFCAASLIAADEDKPQGRVCISIVDSAGPSPKEEPFRSSAAARPGSTVHAHIDASNKCIALVVALSKDGKLANGWRPQLADVPAEFEEVPLPKSPVAWEWSGSKVPFDLYVLFLPPESKEIAEARKLVEAMQGLKVDDRLLAMQVNKIRELIGRITNDKEKANQAPMTEPELGGVFRGGEDAVFPWRQFAQSIDFAAGHPGVLILSSEGAPKDSPAP